MNRAAIIQSVLVSANLSSTRRGGEEEIASVEDEKPIYTIDLVERHLPVLAGCLSKQGSVLHLSFSGQIPSIKVFSTVRVKRYGAFMSLVALNPLVSLQHSTYC